MTETLARERASARAVAIPAYVAAFAVWCAFTVAMLQHLDDPTRASFNVRNDTEWDLTLYVRTDRAVRPIGVIGHQREGMISDVIVPGETWRFEWRFAGDEVGASSVTMDDLGRRAFVLVVPDDVERALRARDATPSP